ncbi:C6 zinc finger domain protein [Phlyctema vagabunda]|uniref:C6 zinc finger domain protein n=1 Tax=Phlyctema vagabunda TaxID=108571 RepID=A0ABR4P2V6_9HELO
MAAARYETAIGTAPIRQSCDRCHGQKLRCTRVDPDNTGACGRCLRRRVKCTYSQALPKGRPSIYYLGEKSTTTGTVTGNITPFTPALTSTSLLEASTSPRPLPSSGSLSDNSTWCQSVEETSPVRFPIDSDGWPQPDYLAWGSAVDHAFLGSDDASASSALSDLVESTYRTEAPDPHQNRLGCDKNTNWDSDTIATQLCYLSTSLARLRPLSPNLPTPIIDDKTFDSVAGWLVEAPGSQNSRHIAPLGPQSIGSILLHLFSGTQQILDILHDASSSKSCSLSYNTNNVVYHMLIACHTMLLDMYGLVLDILEQGAHLSQTADAAALGNIRLFSVVQLCFYLTERQSKAMATYLSHQPPSSVPPWTDSGIRVSPEQPVWPFPATHVGAQLRDLGMGVREKLAHLQRTLCF